MWTKLRDAVGRVWSGGTTMLLAALVVAVPSLQAIDPSLLPTWAKITIALLGTFTMVLRVIAPPPPSVVVNRGDGVIVDRTNGVVTVEKNTAIPLSLVTKVPGEKM